MVECNDTSIMLSASILQSIENKDRFLDGFSETVWSRTRVQGWFNKKVTRSPYAEGKALSPALLEGSIAEGGANRTTFLNCCNFDHLANTS